MFKKSGYPSQIDFYDGGLPNIDAPIWKKEYFLLAGPSHCVDGSELGHE